MTIQEREGEEQEEKIKGGLATWEVKVSEDLRSVTSSEKIKEFMSLSSDTMRGPPGEKERLDRRDSSLQDIRERRRPSFPPLPAFRSQEKQSGGGHHSERSYPAT